MDELSAQFRTAQPAYVVLVERADVVYVVEKHERALEGKAPCKNRISSAKRDAHFWAENASAAKLEPLLFLLEIDFDFKAGFSVGEKGRAETDFFETKGRVEFAQQSEKLGKVCVFINYYAFDLVELRQMLEVGCLVSEHFSY